MFTAWGPRLEKEGIEAVEKGVSRASEGGMQWNAKERSSPGVRECHELRNCIAKQLNEAGESAAPLSAETSKFRVFQNFVQHGCRRQITFSSSNLVLLVDSIDGIYAVFTIF